jgi:hypothetical protein
MDSKNFPTVLFIRNDDSNNEKASMLAYASELDAVENDGPTLVARYELVGVRELVKMLFEV